MIRRLEQRIVRAYNFILDVAYYLTRGHTLRNAIRLARDTL